MIIQAHILFLSYYLSVFSSSFFLSSVGSEILLLKPRLKGVTPLQYKKGYELALFYLLFQKSCSFLVFFGLFSIQAFHHQFELEQCDPR